MINKLRHAFTTSFRYRILINILISMMLAVLCYGGLSLYFNHFNAFHLSVAMRDIICFLVALGIFIIIFIKLINMNFRYIDELNKNIQQVTLGNYDTCCDIEYDDELGMLAANINALSNTLKQKEEESKILKENERLAYDAERKAVNQKNEMITNVAHDLRTPLTTIIGYIDLIAHKDLSAAQAKEYANIAYDKSLRLKSMMDDLFEFTKITDTNMKMNLHIIDIGELLYQMGDEFYPQFEEHGIKLIYKIPNTPLNVVGDGQLLARVFENLITNALKYGYDHSPLTIEVIPDDSTVTIKVINEGDTIDKEDLPYLFDKFYRTDASRGTAQGGTGLGLAIAKNIVEMHKGEILVTSRDHLTSFIVILKRFKKETN